MQNIVLPVGWASGPRYLLPAHSRSLPNIKIAAHDQDADGATRDEGNAPSAHDVLGARPLATHISDRCPIEIYENVIEYLYPWKPALAIAALVSRTWYPRAASRLYHTVVIRRRASYELLVKQLRTSPRVQRWLQSTHKVAFREGPGIPFLDAFPMVFGPAALPCRSSTSIGSAS
ncbi:uncharacterized protein B0H18DRAFT_333421 [Fomitopsis serialis]|uniref:uncharacterized protein n=1 Tax=Fomitopsis serialis TaxID=139415 RepID=UPI0020085B2B|nr:uncharacterized protein B0H18DRAFT_333421 [Neoantrodia serialis]KAH9926803.1 hypothetical protein B0H18DRAFT_333421 [Neoantrodia serialis]